MGTLRSTFGLVVTLALIACTPAGAAMTLSAERPLARDCASALVPGAPGTASRAWTARDDGLLTVRLLGDERPDWDLALFRDGEPLAASTAFGSRETATAWVAAGDAVTAQACRRDGSRAEIPIAFELTAAEPAAAPRVSLVNVPVSGPVELRRLEQLGLDVTHDVGPEGVSVVLYGRGDRRRLERAGFASETLIPDMAAADAAARESENRAVARSALPSGRDTYRQYVDYTDELKALAQSSPALVRQVTLGTSLEGRPIEGVEIAAGVHRTDDGRPVFLNLGGHHAREWPSAEFPMEFARELVAAYEDAGHPLHARVLSLLASVRIVTVPVVNVDGFIASRSHGTSALDDDPNLTAGFSAGGIGAYRRKNCRPQTPAEAATPCAARGSSGVDLNRNYGYWWGGPGSSATQTSQSYRGTGPFSEPESQAVHAFSSGVHPTVVISNHTFTDDGWWLRQPGFNGAFFPQGPSGDPGVPIGAITPDEPAMKALGDAMGAATGWPSDLAWLLGDITGATEDWNYFAQGSYGYTPEARGPNFHANYAQMVVSEYVGVEAVQDDGVREAFMLAGETAADEAHHSVIQGTAPPGVTLRLRKQFLSPSHPNAPGAPTTAETLDTTLEVGAGGTYEWHVNPSSRPDIDSGPGQNPPAETWTMTCERAGQGTFGPRQVSVTRGAAVVEDWAAACGTDPVENAPPAASFTVSPSVPVSGQEVAFVSTSDDPDGAIAATAWDLDDDGAFDDSSELAATRTFTGPGSYEVSLQVTDDDGATDTEAQVVTVAAPPPGPPGPQEPPPSCRGEFATISGTVGTDRLRGTEGDDVIATFGGADRVNGRGGDDVICGGKGPDRLSGGSGEDILSGAGGADRLRGGPGNDRLVGGPGRDRCAGGPGSDAVRRCP